MRIGKRKIGNMIIKKEMAVEIRVNRENPEYCGRCRFRCWDGDYVGNFKCHLFPNHEDMTELKKSLYWAKRCKECLRLFGPKKIPKAKKKK